MGKKVMSACEEYLVVPVSSGPDWHGRHGRRPNPQFERKKRPQPTARAGSPGADALVGPDAPRAWAQQRARWLVENAGGRCGELLDFSLASLRHVERFLRTLAKELEGSSNADVRIVMIKLTAAYVGETVVRNLPSFRLTWEHDQLVLRTPWNARGDEMAFCLFTKIAKMLAAPSGDSLLAALMVVFALSSHADRQEAPV